MHIMISGHSHDTTGKGHAAQAKSEALGGMLLIVKDQVS
jgi:hypothetical protein